MSFMDTYISKPGETHGPLMSITCWSLTAIALVFLVLRLCIRQSQGKLWLDDGALGISWILLLAQVTLLQLGINLGYGSHSLDLDLSHVDAMIYYGASLLTISTVATTLSKISFGITLLRLTDGWLRRFVYFAIATLAIFAVPAAVVPWIQCKPLAKTFLDILPGTCINKHPSLTYGRFQAIWSAIIDVALALLPWKILWNLQMRFAEKIGVGVAMSLGLLAGVTSVVRAVYVDQLAAQDVSFDSYKSIIWSVAECSMTIIATSIPVLRVVFKQVVNSAMEGYNSSGPSRASKPRTNPPTTTSWRGRRGSTQQSSKKTVDISISGDSLKDVFGKSSQNYVELDDLVVDHETGRVTASTPDSLPGVPERHEPNWPV